MNKIDKILSYLKTLKITDFDEKLFRKRTAAEIIKEGFVTGCTDSDLVFVAFARGCGILLNMLKQLPKLGFKVVVTQFKDISTHKFLMIKIRNGCGLIRWEAELALFRPKVMGVLFLKPGWIVGI